MFDFLSANPAVWQGQGIFFASGASFLWGLASALLSPCHLGIIPLLGSHAAESKNPIRQALLFTLGTFTTIPLIGLIFALLGHGLELSGHWWTIPAGVMLLWFGVSMFRNHSCSHATHIWDTLRRRLGLSAKSGAWLLGFGYGILASGCSAGFLMPLLLVTLSQGIALSVFFAACFGLGHTLPMAVVGCSISFAGHFLHNRSEEPHGHDSNGHCLEHTHDHNGCLDEPHKGERLFRQIMGAIIILAGIAFIVHPLME